MSKLIELYTDGMHKKHFHLQIKCHRWILMMQNSSWKTGIVYANVKNNAFQSKSINNWHFQYQNKKTKSLKIFTSLINRLHTVLRSLLRVALNIMTCFAQGDRMNMACTSFLITTTEFKKSYIYSIYTVIPGTWIYTTISHYYFHTNMLQTFS